MTRKADVIVIGAGVAGVAVAYHLAVRHGVGKVVVVDPRPPLTLTSDKSTEAYRNWWPSRPMTALMSRSIDLLEEMSDELGGAFGLSRRGYLFVTSDRSTLQGMREQAALTSDFGGGAVREHPGPESYGPAEDGVDILDPGLLRERFPFVIEKAVGAVHVRRAGWFSAQTFGAWMLDRARDCGAELIASEATGIDGRRVTLDDGSTIEAEAVVVAAGPMSKDVAEMAGVDLPVHSELHLKVAFRDRLGAIPRDAPMMIWSDQQHIDWSGPERAELERIGRSDAAGLMPAFCHMRPEGGADSSWLVALWEYRRQVMEPTWPLPADYLYPEVVIRGLAAMAPGLAAYLDGLPEISMDGGYYTKTRRNRPLIGPSGAPGIHLATAMSGFGVMAAAGAGDLAARHITGSPLPDYATDFLLSRCDDPAAGTESSGQL